MRKIHELGVQGVQFATFPETVVPYYPYFSFIQSPYRIIAGSEHRKLLEQAVTVPSPSTDAMSEPCRQELLSRSALTNGIRELCTTRSFSLMPTASSFSVGARSHPHTTRA